MAKSQGALRNRRALFGRSDTEIDFMDGFWLPNTSLLSWGGVFCDMLDLPAILPILTDLIGPRFRLDHVSCAT